MERSGLVLGGGGARGQAHVGVLQVLEREGYPIDLIAGTSMGGLIAGLYGLYGNTGALLDLISQPADNEATKWSRAPRPELMESRRFRRWLRQIVGERTFADLLWPVAMTAVDIDTGEEVVIHQGPVVAGIYATTALPGAYTPITINERWLVDGGLLNPLPVDVAQQMGATVTLAVDVLPEKNRRVARLPTSYHRAMLRKFLVAMGILAKSFDIVVGAQRDYRLRDTPPDLLITPDLRGLLHNDYHRADELVARGVAAAEAALPEIRQLRDRILAGRPERANGRVPQITNQVAQRRV
jgi:NTE family protein